MKHLKDYDRFINENINEAKDMPSLDSNTGLIYYFEIPFTSEDVEEIIASSKAILNAKFTPNKQFEIQPMIFIKDKVNGGEHTYSVAQIGILGAFFDKNKNSVASRKDFVNESKIHLDLYNIDYSERANARYRVASDRINLKKVANASKESWSKDVKIFGDNELGFGTDKDRKIAIDNIQKSFDNGHNNKNDFELD